MPAPAFRPLRRACPPLPKPRRQDSGSRSRRTSAAARAAWSCSARRRFGWPRPLTRYDDRFAVYAVRDDVIARHGSNRVVESQLSTSGLRIHFGDFAATTKGHCMIDSGKFSRRRFIAGAVLPLLAVGLNGRQGFASANAATLYPTVVRGPRPVPKVLTINGREHSLPLEPRATLLDTLRDHLQLTDTKKGCDQGTCGVCCGPHRRNQHRRRGGRDRERCVSRDGETHSRFAHHGDKLIVYSR